MQSMENSSVTLLCTKQSEHTLEENVLRNYLDTNLVATIHLVAGQRVLTHRLLSNLSSGWLMKLLHPMVNGVLTLWSSVSGMGARPSGRSCEFCLGRHFGSHLKEQKTLFSPGLSSLACSCAWLLFAWSESSVYIRWRQRSTCTRISSYECLQSIASTHLLL